MKKQKPTKSAQVVRWNGPYWGTAPDGTLPANFFLSAFFDYAQEMAEIASYALEDTRSKWDDAFDHAFDAATRAAKKVDRKAESFECLLPDGAWPLFMHRTNAHERSARGNLDAQSLKAFLILALEREYNTREMKHFGFWRTVATKGCPTSDIKGHREKFSEAFALFLEDNEAEGKLFKESGFTIDDLMTALLDSPQEKETPTLAKHALEAGVSRQLQHARETS